MCKRCCTRLSRGIFRIYCSARLVCAVIVVRDIITTFALQLRVRGTLFVVLQLFHFFFFLVFNDFQRQNALETIRRRVKSQLNLVRCELNAAIFYLHAVTYGWIFKTVFCSIVWFPSTRRRNKFIAETPELSRGCFSCPKCKAIKKNPWSTFTNRKKYESQIRARAKHRSPPIHRDIRFVIMSPWLMRGIY